MEMAGAVGGRLRIFRARPHPRLALAAQRRLALCLRLASQRLRLQSDARSELIREVSALGSTQREAKIFDLSKFARLTGLLQRSEIVYMTKIPIAAFP